MLPEKTIFLPLLTRKQTNLGAILAGPIPVTNLLESCDGLDVILRQTGRSGKLAPKCTCMYRPIHVIVRIDLNCVSLDY